MRLLLVAVALLLTPAPALAQYRAPDLAAQRAAMDRLEPLAGHWRGRGDVLHPQAMTVFHDERAERDLDGLVMVMRGTGYANAEHAGAPVFRAIGFISYNDSRGIYEVRSYALGHAVTATGEFLPTGEFRWGFAPGGPVQIRYTISFSEDAWREIGEMSYDNGATWRQSISLELSRAD